jgi:hypothetical protein
MPPSVARPSLSHFGSSQQDMSWFAWYVAGMVAIGLVASLKMPDTRRYGYLAGTGEVER